MTATLGPWKARGSWTVPRLHALRVLRDAPGQRAHISNVTSDRYPAGVTAGACIYWQTAAWLARQGYTKPTARPNEIRLTEHGQRCAEALDRGEVIA